MEVKPWNFVVLTIIVLLAAAAVWLFRATRSRSGASGPSWTAPMTAAALLLGLSGWLLYTLVLEETHVDIDGSMLVGIGAPALLGGLLAVIAARRFRTR